MVTLYFRKKQQDKPNFDNYYITIIKKKKDLVKHSVFPTGFVVCGIQLFSDAPPSDETKRKKSKCNCSAGLYLYAI